MTPRKFFQVMLGVLGVTVLGCAAVFYLVDRSLAERAERIAVLKADQEVLQQQITVYEAAQRKVDELSFIDEIADQVLPSEKSQSKAVAELRQFALASGISIESLEFTGSTNADPNVSQTKGVSGLNGVRVLPASLRLGSNFTYSQLMDFLDRIERNRRKIQVTGLTLSPNSQNRVLFNEGTVVIEIYLQAKAAATEEKP